MTAKEYTYYGVSKPIKNSINISNISLAKHGLIRRITPIYQMCPPTVLAFYLRVACMVLLSQGDVYRTLVTCGNGLESL